MLGKFKGTLSAISDREWDWQETPFFTRPGESFIGASNRLGLFDLGELKQQNKTFDQGQTNEPQPINTEGPPEILSDDTARIIRAMTAKNYRVARNSSKNFNLNIVGLRNDDPTPNSFNDQIWVFWKYENKWTLKKFKATTDPGLTWLTDPGKSAGTAILKEGQYLGSHRLGKHRGKYEALVQASPVTVIRDFNRDRILDFDSGKEQTGIFGINIHRATEKGESAFVNKWSAGCQVFARSAEYADFMKLCKAALAEWGDTFSYTLMRESSLSS